MARTRGAGCRSSSRLNVNSTPTYSKTRGRTPASSNSKETANAKGINQAVCSTKRGKTLKWSEADMISAINHIKSEPSASVRKAALLFNVPRSTLRDRLSGKIAVGAKPGRKPLLNVTLEQKLIDYASNRAKLGIGFGKTQFLHYAGSLARKYNVRFKNGVPTNRWWSNLKSRHGNKFTLRQPEGTASVRHQCMDKVKVTKYFAALNQVMTENGLLVHPESIWNMDETGLQLDVKPRKVVAKKGTKNLHSRTSGNRESITVIACVNAAGKYIPPQVIVKGKTCKSLMGFNTESAPPGTNWSFSDSGWTKQGLAKLWFERTFLKNIGLHRPQLLVLDGHDSHNFLELIEMAIQNEIHIVEMPSHTSNWLQPCDRTLFKPLKDYYRSTAQDLMGQFPGIITCRSNFAGLFASAWERAMTPDNIISGFRSCGIYPFDPEAIPSDAYLPNYLHTVEQIVVNPSIVDNSETCVGDGQTNVENEVPGNTDESLVTITQNQDGNQLLTEIPSNADKIVTPSPSQCLTIIENEMNPAQLTTYNYLFDKGFDLESDRDFVTWRALKLSLKGLIDEAPTLANSKETEIIQDNNYSVELQPSSSLHEVSLSDFVTDFDGPIDDQVVAGLLKQLQDNIETDEATFFQSSNVPANSVYSEVVAQEEIQPLPVVTNTEVVGSDFPFMNTSYPGDGDDDVLKYPEPTARKKTAVRGGQHKFFVLTSKEAYAAKLKYQQDKIRMEREKRERKQQRIANAAKRKNEKAEQAALVEQRKLERAKKIAHKQKSKIRKSHALPLSSHNLSASSHSESGTHQAIVDSESEIHPGTVASMGSLESDIRRETAANESDIHLRIADSTDANESEIHPRTAASMNGSESEKGTTSSAGGSRPRPKSKGVHNLRRQRNTTKRKNNFEEPRYQAKERKISGKMLKEKIKQKTRNYSSPNQNCQEDRTPCETCKVVYCEDVSGRNWIQCQKCQNWNHNACQGLEENPPKKFFCITCENDCD